MKNDRSLKVDVSVNGYRDEDGKYNTLSYDVSIPKDNARKVKESLRYLRG